MTPTKLDDKSMAALKRVAPFLNDLVDDDVALRDAVINALMTGNTQLISNGAQIHPFDYPYGVHRAIAALVVGRYSDWGGSVSVLYRTLRNYETRSKRSGAS